MSVDFRGTSGGFWEYQGNFKSVLLAVHQREGLKDADTDGSHEEDQDIVGPGAHVRFDANSIQHRLENVF